jgi:hypothetical protein
MTQRDTARVAEFRTRTLRRALASADDAKRDLAIKRMSGTSDERKRRELLGFK